MTASSRSQSIRVLLFARYSELLGRATIDLPAALGTVGEVVRTLRALPGGEALPDKLVIALNLQQVEEHQPVQPGDELE